MYCSCLMIGSAHTLPTQRVTCSTTGVYSTSCLLNMVSTCQYMNCALAEKPVSQLAPTLKHCHHYHLVQVAIGPPHLQIEYLCRLVACNDVTRRPIKSGPLRYCSMFLIFTCLGLITHYCTATTIHSYTHHHHIYIPPPHATTTTQCKLHECK